MSDRPIGVFDSGLGGLTVTSDLANAAIARGYRLILIGFDTMLLQRAAGDVLNAIDRG